MPAEFVRTIGGSAHPSNLMINTPSRYYDDSGKIEGERELTPYGAASVATDAARRLGPNEVGMLDAEFHGLPVHRVLDIVADTTGGEHGTVGMNVLTPTFPIAMSTGIELAKRHPHLRQVYGGPHATLDPESILRFIPTAIVVQGDGWQTFAELCEGKHPSLVNGTVFVSDGRIARGGSGFPNVIKDVDSVPWLERSLLANEPYHKGDRTAASFITSYGCRGRCGFCITPTIYQIKKAGGAKKVSHRSIPDVINEVVDVKGRLNLTMAQFIDDDMIPSVQRAQDFLDGWGRAGLARDMEFIALLRPDLIPKLYDLGILQDLYFAGLRKISIGIETGHDRGRRMVSGLDGKIDSKYDPDILAQAIRATNHVGIETKGFAMIGLPGETREEIRDTVDFLLMLRDIGLDRVAVFPFKPYPATPLFEHALQMGFTHDELGHYNSPNVAALIAAGVNPVDATRDGYTPTVQLSEVPPAELEIMAHDIMTLINSGQVNSITAKNFMQHPHHTA